MWTKQGHNIVTVGEFYTTCKICGSRFYYSATERDYKISCLLQDTGYYDDSIAGKSCKEIILSRVLG